MKNLTFKGILTLIIFFLFFSISKADILEKPRKIGIDNNGYVYVLHGEGMWRYLLRKYTAKGEYIKLLDEIAYEISWNNKRHYLSFANERGLMGTNKLTGAHRITKAEIIEITKYFRIEPKEESILKMIIYPSDMILARGRRLYAIGKGINGKKDKVGIIDPDDGHPISIFEMEDSERNRYPTGIAVNREENIYLVDYATKYVYRYTNDGKLLNKWGGYGGKNGQFKEPWAVAVDQKTGDVYVSDIYVPRKEKPRDHSQRRIQVFDKYGKYKRKWGGNKIVGIDWFNLGWMMKAELGDVVDMAIDSKSNVYLLERNMNRISKYTSKGGLIKRWGKLGDKTGEFNSPEGICVDKDDNVYVADTDNNRIQKFDENGKFLGEIK